MSIFPARGRRYNPELKCLRALDIEKPESGLNRDRQAPLEQWELANFKPEYQFIVRQYAIGKGHSVSVMWRSGEVDTIFGFAKEGDALQWIKDKSQGWLLENKS